MVLLIGGSTGRDGIGGSQFASDKLESENRSAVQIPDPFIEKLVIEAILEARNQGCIKAMKDLGGGGLSCAISETSDALGVGMDLDLTAVHKRERDMSPTEVMISESQERMLVITTAENLERLTEICEKFRVPISVIGEVTENGMMHVKSKNETVALLPSGVVANAPLLDRPSVMPKYLENPPHVKKPKEGNLSRSLLRLLSSPNIASRQWVYTQYDHEVGIRTVIKPGQDAPVLRLDNGKFLSVKIDGNSKHCYLNPRQGVMGCFDEACRNVVCTGATPIGMVDHLQFGNPEDPEIFWTFKESVEGISEYAKYFEIPCVGGKVSLYNETDKGPIKPTPLIGVLGLIEGKPLVQEKANEKDILMIVGITIDEMGGYEYYELLDGIVGGNCPSVDLESSRKNQKSILDIAGKGLIKSAHDCSKGGMAVSVAELCMAGGVGCVVTLEKVPSDRIREDELMFSESHSRFLLVVSPSKAEHVSSLLQSHGVIHAVIGKFSGRKIAFRNKTRLVASVMVDKAQEKWLNSLGSLVSHG